MNTIKERVGILISDNFQSKRIAKDKGVQNNKRVNSRKLAFKYATTRDFRIYIANQNK